MKTIKVDKVILYYMDRVDPDGNLYRFYMYKGMASFGDIGFDYKLWTDVYDEYRKRHVRKAIEEEKKFLAEKIIKAEDSRKIDIIKRYLSEYEYLLDEMPKRDFKPFE